MPDIKSLKKNINSKKILLHINYIYIIIYIVYVIICIDFILFNGILKNILPESPNQISLYTIIFVLPHIIGSFFSFAEKKYIVYYKMKLVWIPILIIPIYIITKVPLEYNIFIFILISFRHVFIQQFYLL